MAVRIWLLLLGFFLHLFRLYFSYSHIHTQSIDMMATLLYDLTCFVLACLALLCFALLSISRLQLNAFIYFLLMCVFASSESIGPHVRLCWLTCFVCSHVALVCAHKEMQNSIGTYKKYECEKRIKIYM